MRYVDEEGNPLAPTKRLGPHAPQSDQIDNWHGYIACDMEWQPKAESCYSDQRGPGCIGRYWLVLSKLDDLITLEWVS